MRHKAIIGDLIRCLLTARMVEEVRYQAMAAKHYKKLI